MQNIKNTENKKLAGIYSKTVEFFETYPLENNVPFIFEIEPKNIDCEELSVDIKKFSNSYVEIKSVDVLVMAKRYILKGFNPIILNFASKILPGGGVTKGAISQEEDIFRRTNLFQTLNNDFVKYPLKSIVYSHNVYVAKDVNYAFLKEPFSLACVSAAALRWPKITNIDGKEYFSNKKDEEYIRNSIETIFKIAILYNHDSIILGAWGCGAYEGPRDTIALIFKENIQKYRMYFRRIGFAILIRNERDRENYNIFKKYLENDA